MLVRVVGGNLIDVRGRRAVIIPCMFVQAAATCIIALVAILFAPALRLPVLPFLFLAGFLAGAAHGFLYPAMSALLMDVTPERRRGSAVGIFSSVILVGNSFGAIAFGYVAHGLGYAVMWSALTVLLLVGSCLSVRLRVGYARAGAGARARVLSGGAVDLPRRRADTGSHDVAWEARRSW